MKGVMTAAHRLSSHLRRAITLTPGRQVAFYKNLLSSEIATALADSGLAATGDLVTRTFNLLKRDGFIVYRDNAWWPSATPDCPHCHRPWPEGTF